MSVQSSIGATAKVDGACGLFCLVSGIYCKVIIGYYLLFSASCCTISATSIPMLHFMAKPVKRINKDGSVTYKIYVNCLGKRESRTFSNKHLAIAWADKRKKELEHESVHGSKNTNIIKDVIQNYIDQFAANYGRSKNYDLARLLNYDIALLTVDKLSSKVIIEHCVERNKQAKPQTVLNDVTWLRSVLKTMSAVEGYYYDPVIFDQALTVLRKEGLVGRSTRRDRLPTFREMIRLLKYFKGSRTKVPMVDIILFAYFSARRLSEITRLEWADNNDDKLTGMVRDAKHPTKKLGNHKRFKYQACAWRIVQRQAITDKFIFPYNPKTISTLFDRACRLLEINDLHFHDLRHAATTRLFTQGYSIEQVQLFTLHDDWKTLARYTHLKPEHI